MSHWYDSTPKKSRRKRDSNPGSSALEADALPLGQRGGLPRTGKTSRGQPSCRWQDDIAKNVGTTRNNNNNNNNDNRIQRRYSRFFTISSQRRELSPTRTVKWPGRNRVQITCDTSSAHHVQVSCYVPLVTKGQLSY